jgi:hypothetical protein
VATLIAAALCASLLTAAPCAAFTATVNTEAYYGDVYDDFLSFGEAIDAARYGPGRCMSAAEMGQLSGMNWFATAPGCWLPAQQVGGNTNDVILFTRGVGTIHVSANDMVLTCGDIIDGGRADYTQANVRIDFAAHRGIELSCSDLGRPDLQVRNLVLDHAGTHGILSFGLHGATIENVKVADSIGDGLALLYGLNNSDSPRRIQVKGSVFVRNGLHGIRVEAATGAPDDVADHEITIVGNLIGLESLDDQGANGNTLGGIRAVHSRRIKIGGVPADQRNIVSGNGGPGIDLAGVGLTEAQVFNNWVGIGGRNGDVARPNNGSGIRLSEGASSNKIGQDNASGNIVSGNANDGITLDGAGTNGNLVAGNVVGLNVDRNAAIPNAGSGVALLAGASNNTIGSQVAINLLAGNGNRGVFIADPGTNSNQVSYNWIGVANNTRSIANSGGGVLVTAGAHNTRIGPANVISGNSGVGVEIAGSGTLATLVDANSIGVNAANAVDLPNTSHGVLIHLDADAAEVRGNTIARNLGDCIRLADSGTNTHQVLGNWLFGCGGDGLSIQGASFTTVGGVADGTQPNNIQINSGAAVRVTSGVGNRIRGNGMLGNGLEVALGPSGLAPNDWEDADPGGNLLQNSPVLLRAVTGPNSWIGLGRLYSAPNTTYQIDYYGGTCGVDRRGEPSYYLGSANATTNAQGFADVSFLGFVHVTQSHLMATATDPAGNTSQITPCRSFGDSPKLVFDDGFETGFVDAWSRWTPGFP